MIRNKIGMLLGAGVAALAIGVFANAKPADAAVMNPQIHTQIRPYVELGFGNDGCAPGYYGGVAVPVYVGPNRWDHRDFHRDWGRDRDFHGDRGGRDFHGDRGGRGRR